MTTFPAPHTHPGGVLCGLTFCGSQGPNAAILDSAPVTLHAKDIRPGDYVAEWNGLVSEVRKGAITIQVTMYRFTMECEVTVAMGWDDHLTVTRPRQTGRVQ